MFIRHITTIVLSTAILTTPGISQADRAVLDQNDHPHVHCAEPLQTIEAGAPTLQANKQPLNRTVKVVLETELGDIELALYPERAPISTANFLTYVDNGHYDGASFYRVTYGDPHAKHRIVQGGLLAEFIRYPIKQPASLETVLPAVTHETTCQTGIRNKRGTVALGRIGPGTATSEFFININDNPMLDTGFTENGRDGLGYATFAKVLRGMQILEQIQLLPTGLSAANQALVAQLLVTPVKIITATRRQR